MKPAALISVQTLMLMVKDKGLSSAACCSSLVDRHKLRTGYPLTSKIEYIQT